MMLKDLKIKLVEDTINQDDISDLINWLSTNPKLTKGPLTKEFEFLFSKWIGSKYSVFVNSGSSANLLMFYCLIYLNKLKNKKIVVPSLSWVTDLSPVIQFGLEPILVDCNLNDLSCDLNHLESIFIEEKPSCFISVSVLGLVPEMDKLVDLCNKYDVILLEDNCESQGSSFNNIKLGNFGTMSSFSTYFGHTMSTIEGGIITTNSDEIYETLVKLRSHGWSRDLSNESKEKLNLQWSVDEFSSMYTFFVPGFNLRSTDLQAFIGLSQLKKVDDFINKRNQNFFKFKKLLSGKTWFPIERQNTFISSFCIPIIVKNKETKLNLVSKLIENGIECRPLISGSMGTQPFYIEKYGEKNLENCDIVDTCGIYIPNHPNLSDSDIELMCKIILENI